MKHSVLPPTSAAFLFLLLSCSSLSSSSSSFSLSSTNPPSYLKEGLSEDALKLAECTDYQAQIPMKSVGEERLLVVPVVMGGAPTFSAEQLARIQNVFFGENLSATSGNYFSLAEYYQKTSLGKFSLKGEVLPVLNCSEKVSDLESTNSYVPGIPAYYLRQQQSEDFLKNYDLDNDGYVDGVAFVYSSPFSNNDAYYWAFTNTFAKQTSGTKPSLGRHIWMSIDFLQSDGYTNDGHTIIHEFGHMLGLRDYYPSDNAYLPLGGMSMMDYNILDHDPYSKTMLAWAEPLYYQLPSGVTTTITLKPFEGSNQYILLNDGWNHSALAEYLMIEYYTPTGLNALDSSKQYVATTAQRPLGFTKPGIKIYHVDSRVAKVRYDSETATYSFSSYVESIPTSPEENVVYQIGANNTNKYSYTDARRQGRYKQVGLVENKATNTLQNGATADDASLFYAGDTFDSASNVYLPNGVFNDKSTIGYSLHVDALDADGATLSLTKKE